MTFSPCTDQEYNGKKIMCVGKFYNWCRDDCEFNRLKKEVSRFENLAHNEEERRLTLKALRSLDGLPE
jgi:hypothetical protein